MSPQVRGFKVPGANHYTIRPEYFLFYKITM